jgi:nucleotide-binding universal stress UspA family protein
LAPLDGSRFAEQALTKAEALAKETGANITLLRVIQSLDEGSRKILFASEAAVEATLASWRAAAEHYLQQVATQLQTSGLTTGCKVIFGDPAPTILQVTADEHADLIVMTTHGRTGLKRWFYGSVASKVLQGAQCPLLLVRNSPRHADAHVGFVATSAPARPMAETPQAPERLLGIVPV